MTVVNALATTGSPTLTSHVIEGAVIKAVYCEVWIKGLGASDADTQFNLAIYKNPGGNHVMTYAETLTMMGYDNKKNILFSSQGVVGGIGGGQSVPVIREWLKIPKGKQRFGLGDTFIVTITTTGQSLDGCALFVYKEYR